MDTSRTDPSTAPTTDAILSSELNDQDVLMGRGLGASQYIGNKSFLRIVEGLKPEYNQTKSYKKKALMARRVFSAVSSSGGRFLRPKKPTKGSRNVVRDGVWFVAAQEDALEKCKQALRQHRDPPAQEAEKKQLLFADPRKDADEPGFANFTGPGRNAFYRSVENTSAEAEKQKQGHPTTSLLAMTTGANVATPSFQQMRESLCAGVGGDELGEQIPNFALRTLASTPSDTKEETEGILKIPMPGDEKGGDEELPRVFGPMSDSFAEDLARLSVAGCLTFSEEQEKLERCFLTDAEREAVMSDMFGKQCTVDDSLKRKRAKRDFDKESMAFALRRMRNELKEIPEDRKQALTTAQAKCSNRSYEFGDDRLSSFLRREGMNPKLAAERLVRYWESRLEVFGPKKYLMCMTLNEALQDDLTAIQHGVACILPHLDSAGRRILYVEPHRRSSKRYSSESLLRALWYLMEVLSSEDEVESRGFVSVTWVKNATIWDYDHYVYSRLPQHQDSCFPIQQVGAHACCPDWISRKIIDPVVAALVSKESRLRRSYHCVTENEITGVLSEYGIASHMLPTEMGGTVQLSQSKWNECCGL